MFSGTVARTGKTWPPSARPSASPGPVPETCTAFCARWTAAFRLSELRSSLSLRMASCSTASASSTGRNCRRETAKSVASQTLALTRCDVLPARSFGKRLERLLLPAWLPQLLPLACARPPSRPPESSLPVPKRASLAEEPGVPGHWARTSEASEAMSKSGETPSTGLRSKRSKVASYSSVSPDISVVLEASRLRRSGAQGLSWNSSRSSGRHASGGREQPKYSW
mmetsp:Transcript_55543/g.162328  ORF Transcript_55543/g.162328 Transcript_55543/m.162328 type:complete len:225 (-) Transcript_55543:920-1594(-)